MKTRNEIVQMFEGLGEWTCEMQDDETVSMQVSVIREIIEMLQQLSNILRHAESFGK